jgi:hypothetical protein
MNDVRSGGIAMFKGIFTLLRGQGHEAGERMSDRYALSILRQQIRNFTQPERRFDMFEDNARTAHRPPGTSSPFSASSWPPG